MIKTIALDYSLMFKHPENYVELFLSYCQKNISSHPQFAAIDEFLNKYLREITNNYEYVDNRHLFKLTLAEFFGESDIINISKLLQQTTKDFIDFVFATNQLNPEFKQIVSILNDKNIDVLLIIEPYLNQEIGQLLLDKWQLTDSDIAYISTNETTHYGKNSIRFFNELLDKVYMQNSPDQLMYISSFLPDIELAKKLAITCYYVGDLDIKFSGSINDLLIFINKLPTRIVTNS